MPFFESVHQEIQFLKKLPKKDRDMGVFLRTNGCVEVLKTPYELMIRSRDETDISLKLVKYKYFVYCAILKKDKDAAQEHFDTLRELSLPMLEDYREGNAQDLMLVQSDGIYTGDETSQDENLRRLAKSMQSTFDLMEGLMELTFEAPWV